MSRTAFTILMVSIAAVALAAMWIAWRARAGRDAGVALPRSSPSGEVIDSFPRASYVSTTPAGSPFERVAIPGLQYKGYADLTVRRDGVSVTVTGEAPVHIPAAQLLGTGTARGRVGKAVERDGLSLLRWSTASAPDAGRELESSFRFAEPAEQRRFADAVGAVIGSAATSDTTNQTDTTQEDA